MARIDTIAVPIQSPATPYAKLYELLYRLNYHD